MNLSIKQISPEILQKFYDEFSEEKSFLQSNTYAEFRQKIGEKISRYGIFDGETLIGAAMIQKITTKFKTFLHIPHGPIFKDMQNEDSPVWDKFLQFYIEQGKIEKCDFVRISPLFATTNPTTEFFKKNNFRPAPVHLINPEKTWILDLTQSEEDILKNMKKSTRYEVRRIEKCNIETDIGNAPHDLDTFWALHLETVSRQGFTPFPRNNTKLEIDIFKNDCQIFSAKIDDKYYSSSIILFDKHAAYYHQGSSSYSKAPVSLATIWTAIKEAKRRGCTEFNFWGVVSVENKKHPWWGLSRFKRGFGGAENFVHVHDFPITNKYWLNF